MKLLLCRYWRGGCTEGDDTIHSRIKGVRQGTCMEKRYISLNKINTNENHSKMDIKTSTLEIMERDSFPIDISTGNGRQKKTSFHRQIEKCKNYFFHFDYANPHFYKSKKIESQMEESLRTHFRSNVVYSKSRIHSESTNKGSLNFLIKEKFDKTGSSLTHEGEKQKKKKKKVSFIQEAEKNSICNSNQISTHIDIISNVTRDKICHRKKKVRNTKCTYHVFMPCLNYTLCRFIKTINKTYSCNSKQTGASNKNDNGEVFKKTYSDIWMSSFSASSSCDEFTMVQMYPHVEKRLITSKKHIDMVKKRGILLAGHGQVGNQKRVRFLLQNGSIVMSGHDNEDVHAGGAEVHVGCGEVHSEGGEVHSGDGEVRTGCTDFIFTNSYFHVDHRDGAHNKVNFSTGGINRSEIDVHDEIESYAISFGREDTSNADTNRIENDYELTCIDLDMYMDVFRENFENSTLIDDITDLQPIHLATKEGNIELIKKLLRSGIYINSKTRIRRFTPLHLSASKGDLDSVKFLIDHDADINALSSDNETPLWCASISNHLEVCKYFLQNGALPNLSIGKKYDSPLHAASMMGNFEIVKLLIENGADITCLDLNSLEPVHYASFEGHKGIVKYLIHKQIEKSLDKKMQEIVKIMKKYNVHTKTLEEHYRLKYKSIFKKRITSKILCCAITSGNYKIVEIILKRGADPNYFDLRLQLFPIHAAAITGNLKIFQSLVKRGANIYAKTARNNLPIDLTENKEIKRFILQHSRKINLRNAWLIRRTKKNYIFSRLSHDTFYHVCTFL
ncbi:hypothetical protein, conserved [Plasmodium gonderi]|uniref:Ankyrin n=1 Tax=Plasmodium gonderi TaxID=77519 RepID=A0A1Y1JKP0_PLAGO|nr:hypothetical protein, conserved [Plasmodium gonderi]GAW82991.1 hypothetical protein, conserved [Plasmodium gonderi]